MIRSLSTLHRALLGIALMGSLSFGAAQAFATAGTVERAGSCRVTGSAYLVADCPECPSYSGYCDGWNTECVCWE